MLPEVGLPYAARGQESTAQAQARRGRIISTYRAVCGIFQTLGSGGGLQLANLLMGACHCSFGILCQRICGDEADVGDAHEA